MHRIAIALLCLGILSPAALAADNATTSSTPTPPKSATVGGGIKNPWTTPYSLAIVTVPEPTTLGVLGLGAAALIVRRRRR